jgi:hypothetical protein
MTGGRTFAVLRPAQEYFTSMETSPLPVKGCKIWSYARRSGPLSVEGSLSCHTYCDTVPRFFRSHLKDRPFIRLIQHTNFPYLCSNIPASPEYGVNISQLIRYARACSAYDQFLLRDNLLTKKLMSQGFQMSRLQAAFRKFYDRYNDLIYPYNLSLGHMLSWHVS